jgi:hypothetical protein
MSITGPQNEYDAQVIADLRAKLAAAEKERDEAHIEWEGAELRIEELNTDLATAQTRVEQLEREVALNRDLSKLTAWQRVNEQLAELQTRAETAERALSAATAAGEMTAGARLIVDERNRQISVEGWDLGHDDEHDEGELAKAAACYALDNKFSWPWGFESWKPGGGRIRQLTKAGALIAAEIDRLNRAARAGGGK